MTLDQVRKIRNPVSNPIFMEKKNIESLPTLAKVESMENIKIGHFDQNE